MAKKMFLLRDLHMYIDVDVGLKKMGGEVFFLGGGYPRVQNEIKTQSLDRLIVMRTMGETRRN